MSEQKTKTEKATPKAFKVEPLVRAEDQSVLMDEPLHIINEIIANTNAFVDNAQEDVIAMLYLGSAQRYAMRFIKPHDILDPMQGTFAGIPVIWVESPYHVNLVARVDAPEQG